METFDWFAKWAIYKPHKVAFKEHDGGRAYTFSQIDLLARCTANWLANTYNVGKGDRVAVLADNCLEYIVLFSVAQKMGIVLVPMNYRLATAELGFMLGDSMPKVLFVESKYADKLRGKESIFSGEHLLPLIQLTNLHGQWLRGSSPSHYEAQILTEDSPLMLIYTSGSTGFPKGAMYSHKMLFWNAINTQIRLEITSQDRALNCAPPFHTGAWNVLLTPFILQGAYTLLMRAFDADQVLDVLENDRHTVFWGVPTMLKMMAESGNFHRVDLSNVRYFVVGGESMPIPLIELWHRKGVPVRQGYGLTEVGPNVTSLDHTDAIRKRGSIGTANFFYSIKLVDENGNEVPQGHIGELAIKAPTVTPGYWKNPEATRASLRKGWFHTGDLMRQDEQGYLYVVDRIKNLYISGGENVYPAEVEQVLRKHPRIAEVAIVGVPEPKWGEVGCAYVVLHTGQECSADELTSFCQEWLAKYKIPKHFQFLQQLPLNNAGKIDRRTLKNQSLQQDL